MSSPLSIYLTHIHLMLTTIPDLHLYPYPFFTSFLHLLLGPFHPLYPYPFSYHPSNSFWCPSFNPHSLPHPHTLFQLFLASVPIHYHLTSPMSYHTLLRSEITECTSNNVCSSYAFSLAPFCPVHMSPTMSSTARSPLPTFKSTVQPTTVTHTGNATAVASSN